MILGVEFFVAVVAYLMFVLAIVGGLVFMTVKAVQLSKVTISLFAAVVLNQTHPIVADGGFIGFVAWAVICLGICFLVCLLPRCCLALRFFCTAAVTVVIGIAIVEIAGELIPAFGRAMDAHRKLIHIFARVACMVLTVIGLLQEADRSGFYINFQNVILVNAERLVAAAIFGAGMVLLLSPVDNLWPFGPGVVLTILGLSAAGCFAADYFLGDLVAG